MAIVKPKTKRQQNREAIAILAVAAAVIVLEASGVDLLGLFLR